MVFPFRTPLSTLELGGVHHESPGKLVSVQLAVFLDLRSSFLTTLISKLPSTLFKTLLDCLALIMLWIIESPLVLGAVLSFKKFFFVLKIFLHCLQPFLKE